MDKNIKQVLEDTELSDKAKRVYQDMHKLYGYKKTFVTISDLVKMIHKNRKNTCDTLEELEDAGYIRIQNFGQGKTRAYTVLKHL